MSNYRRNRVPGGTYFFTVVTFGRRPILQSSLAVELLRGAWRVTSAERPFETLAAVILPDHLHCIWRLPPGDADFSTRWRLIKARFTIAASDRKLVAPTLARPGRSRRGVDVWQRRFWEHVVRDERDLQQHVHYVHYNPVKHGYALRAADWAHSTFRRYVNRGWYSLNWGAAEPTCLRNCEPTYGE